MKLDCLHAQIGSVHLVSSLLHQRELLRVFVVEPVRRQKLLGVALSFFAFFFFCRDLTSALGQVRERRASEDAVLEVVLCHEKSMMLAIVQKGLRTGRTAKEARRKEKKDPKTGKETATRAGGGDSRSGSGERKERAFMQWSAY